MEKKKVIFDVDTGSDDSIALITGMLIPEFEILGVCSANGNRCIDYTTENTLRIVELMGNKYPVYRGVSHPYVSVMLGYRPGYPRVHGSGDPTNANVHGDFIDQCPPATIKEQDKSAVVWYIETLMAQEDYSVTLIPLGPLTNLAHAVQIEPKIVTKVKEVMYMGGGWKIGNKSATGEFNVWLDPEAAQVVMNAGFKNFTFVPLDATHEAYMNKEDAARIREIGTPAAEVVASLIEQRIFGYSTFQHVDEPDAAPIHDPLCVAALCDESVLKECIPAHCEIDCGHGAAYGQTIFDIKNGRLAAGKPNCRVALGADRRKFADWMYNVMLNSKNM